jgi:ribosomal-protein-alanine N-acetyltransferase
MIETDRLLLSRPCLSDAPDIHTFLGDPEAMRFTHVAASLRDCRRRVAVHERRRRSDGYAPWSVRLKGSGRLVGWGGLFQDPFDPGWGTELGYWFHPDAWGHGYASELAAAAVREADETFALPKLCAFARPDNVGSRRVLEKAGFKVVRYVPELERDYLERARCGENES